MKIHQKFFLAILISSFLMSCSDDEGDVQISGSVSLSDVTDGEGMIVTSGQESVTITGMIEPTFRGTSSSSGGANAFYYVPYVIESGDDRINVEVFWPQDEGDVMPTGTYPISFNNADPDNPPTERFVAVSVYVNETFYSTFSNSTGTATVNNTNSDYEADIEFNAQNLDVSFEDFTIDVAGAFKYRDQ